MCSSDLFFFPRHLGDPVYQPVEFLVTGAPERGTDLFGLTQVDSPPHLDHLEERVLVFPGKHVHAEGQRLHQGMEGGVPDEGSPAVLDLNDLQGAEGPDGLPERAPGNTQAVAQVGFAGQTVTGAKPVGRYELPSQRYNFSTGQ